MPLDLSKPYEEYRVDRIPYRYIQDGKYYLADGRECLESGLKTDKSKVRYEEGETMKRNIVDRFKSIPGRHIKVRGAR